MKMDNEEKETVHCEHCGKELNETEIYELDGMILCADCFNEESDLREVEEGFI
jgi:formylmethanofuran dehydrogenase subunit E